MGFNRTVRKLPIIKFTYAKCLCDTVFPYVFFSAGYNQGLQEINKEFASASLHM